MYNSSKKTGDARKDFMIQIKMKSNQLIQARKSPKESAWLGLGFFGLIGWSIVVPALLGAALGIWLDHYFSDMRSWTLIFLVTGLLIGCFVAYNWVLQEYNKMKNSKEDNNKNGK